MPSFYKVPQLTTVRRIRPASGTVAIFNLDRTITYTGTYLPFLLGLFLRRPRLRLSLLRLPIDVLLYAMGFLTAKIVRERLWSALAGEADAGIVSSLAEKFASTTVKNGCRAALMDRLWSYQREGTRVILVSASPRVYVASIARHLGIGEVIATEIEQKSGRFTGRILGGICRGAERLRRLKEYLGPDHEYTVHAYGAESDPMLLDAGNGWHLEGDQFVPAVKQEPRNKRLVLLAALALGCGVFAVNLHIERRFVAAGHFVELDTLFDSDPAEYQWVMASGGGSIARGYRHPNLANFLNPPTRLLGVMLSSAFDVEERKVWEVVSEIVGPGFRAASAMAVFLMFVTLGLPLWCVVPLSLLDAMSLSGLIFGSMPESFPISLWAISFFFLLAAEAIRNGGYVRKYAWMASGVFAVGVTVINLGPLACALFVAQMSSRRMWRKSFFLTTKICAMVLTLNVIAYTLISPLYPSFRRNPIGVLLSLHEPNFYKGHVWQTLREFPFTLSDTIAAPLPTRVQMSDMQATAFSYAPTPRNSASAIAPFLAVLTLLVLGTAGWIRKRHEAISRIGLLAFGLLLFNFFLHLIYRDWELFVYSAHWQAPLVILCSGIVFLTGRRMVWGVVAVSLLLLPLGWNNYQVLRFLMENPRL